MANVNERMYENVPFHALILENDANDDVHENGAQLVFIILLKQSNLLNLLKENLYLRLMLLLIELE